MKTLTILLTYLCNRDCSFCSQKELDRDCPTDPDSLIKSLKLSIDENKDLRHVAFLGGEPFTMPGLLDTLVSICKEAGKSVSINTNMTLWKPFVTDWINDNNISIVGSTTGIVTGEKPLIDLDCNEVKKIKKLNISYVIFPGIDENWLESVLGIYHYLDCKAGITLYFDMHRLEEFSPEDIYNLYTGFTKLGFPSWLKLHKIGKFKCNCHDNYVMKPDGKILSRGEYSGATNVGLQDGCSFMRENMTELYNTIMELFNGIDISSTDKS